MKPGLLLALLLSASACSAAEPAGNLAPNGGFEQQLDGWRKLWTRQPGAGQVQIDPNQPRTGSAAAHIIHRGTNDWSFEPDLPLSASLGDAFELEAWVKIQGPGSVTFCASTWDREGRNLSWSEGERTAHTATQWTRLHTRVIAGYDVQRIQPRFIGEGPATLWIDDVSVRKLPGSISAKNRNLPGQLAISNTLLTLTWHTTNGTFSVLDQRTGRTWSQKPAGTDLLATDARAIGNRLEITLVHLPTAQELRAEAALEPNLSEFTVTLHGQTNTELAAPLRFPAPFTSAPGDRLIIPLNEGIAYPVEDSSIEPMRLIAYGGHGICMPFWGVTDDQQAHAVIIETPDDAAIRLLRLDKKLAVAPEWDPQLGELGYSRQLRFVFFQGGGHVPIAKRYRQYARQHGLLKTLADKRGEIPEVDLLIGAVNVWNWDADPAELTTQMRAAGIERILWSRGGNADAIQKLNQAKVLTSRYDIFQDVMDPSRFPALSWIHKDWTIEAWPHDLMLRPNGDWVHGWAVEGKKGEWYDCGVLCDSRALDYVRKRVPAELASIPYKCRSIDTTTASPWRECYHTNHPMTRTQSRVWKMKLLEAISREYKLVTGSETGHDAAVPYVHYFEGMLSLGPYRVPDSGRDMQRIWTEVPTPVAKFQLGHQYRLPLWELVYHDCVVAQWYWGDYNNKLPALWKKRDLFNALYGTPPMFMFNRKLWQEQKDRFVESYQTICPLVREVGYEEMTDHKFLTPDRAVQQTTFANGTIITVNFGDKTHRLPTGELLDGNSVSKAMRR